MRIWSLHPSYLDQTGLIAGWREALLAKAVLGGLTRGYKHHPQLERFLKHPDPQEAINAYLFALYQESIQRSYHFDLSKIGPVCAVSAIEVTLGQLEYEWAHLLRKVASRSPKWLPRLTSVDTPACHPLFKPVPGPLASWERAPNA